MARGPTGQLAECHANEVSVASPVWTQIRRPSSEIVSIIIIITISVHISDNWPLVTKKDIFCNKLLNFPRLRMKVTKLVRIWQNYGQTHSTSFLTEVHIEQTRLTNCPPDWEEWLVPKIWWQYTLPGAVNSINHQTLSFLHPRIVSPFMSNLQHLYLPTLSS